MVVVSHFKYFLLLCSQTILIGIRFIFLLAVHVCKSHRSGHEYVVIILTLIISHLSIIRRCDLLMNIVIMMLLQVVVVQLVKVLVLLLGILVTIVSYISTLLIRTTHCSFLIMTIKILNVETASSLMVS